MAKKPFTVDFRAFDEDFDKLMEKTAPKELEKGLFKAASEMMHDADVKEPKTPFDKGDLRGAKHYEPKKDRKELSIEAGYNLIYAAYQHEKEKTPKSVYNLPGSGPKFLHRKMVMFKKKYIWIVSKSLERLLS